MDIIFKGQHSKEEAIESIQDALVLFKERYKISQFREMHLSLTLVDEQGDNVELIDSETAEVYRVFEVFRHGHELIGRRGEPHLQLIVDNSKEYK